MKIKLCVVSPLYHSSLGGLGRQAKLLTERLAQEDEIDLFVIARRMKRMPADTFSQDVEVLRAWSTKPYRHTYEKFSISNLLISLTFSLSCALLLIKNRKRFDLVHFHGASLPLFINYPLLRLMRKKVIAKVAAANIGTELGSIKGRYFGAGNLVINCMRNIDAIVAISEEIKEGLFQDGFKQAQIVRIPNFIDIRVFKRLSEEEKKIKKAQLLDNNRVCVVFSGRFIGRKGIDYLLRAWKVVSEKTDSLLYLLGDGPLLKDMKELAGALSISEKVVFNGHVNNIVDYLNAGDIFVLPSLQEGMPNSLLEAMACGMSVVATKIGGVEDVVEDGYNGLLVKPGDDQDLAMGILKLIQNSDMRKKLSDNAHKTILENYSLESVVPKYLKLYKEVLKKL